MTGGRGVTGFGRVWTWVAFAATLLALAGLFLRIRGAWPQILSRLSAPVRSRFRPG